MSTIIIEKTPTLEPITRTELLKDLFNIGRAVDKKHYNAAYHLMIHYLKLHQVYFNTWERALMNVEEPIRKDFYDGITLTPANALGQAMELQRILDNDELLQGMYVDKNAGASVSEAWGEAIWVPLWDGDIEEFERLCSVFINIKSMRP